MIELVKLVNFCCFFLNMNGYIIIGNSEEVDWCAFENEDDSDDTFKSRRKYKAEVSDAQTAEIWVGNFILYK